MLLTFAFWTWIGLCAVGSVVGLVGIAKNIISIARLRADDRGGWTSHLVGVAESKEPNINEDPLAIEINKAWYRFNGWNYVSPDLNVRDKIEAIHKSSSHLSIAIEKPAKGHYACDWHREFYEAKSLKAKASKLKNMALCHHWAVREHVALNTNTDPETLHYLSKDDHWFVREAVAKNRNTPLITILLLAEDDHHEIRRYAMERLKAEDE